MGLEEDKKVLVFKKLFQDSLEFGTKFKMLGISTNDKNSGTAFLLQFFFPRETRKCLVLKALDPILKKLLLRVATLR